MSVRDHVDRVLVVDNGSTDRTAQRAVNAGADVIHVSSPGYGRACLAGVAAAENADLLIFMDGDGADDPSDLFALIEPIKNGRADFVVGSRATGKSETGALNFAQTFGNTLATYLMRRLWGGTFTDLGPFRAIKRSAFNQLNMQAPTYGWTVEMQVRALKQGLRCSEVPVAYRRRIGVSKISGTVKGVVLAGGYILGTILWECIRPQKRPKPIHQPR